MDTDTQRRRAHLYVRTWAGDIRHERTVIGETPRRYRVEFDRRAKLPGGRVVEPGVPTLVPRDVVRFGKPARS